MQRDLSLKSWDKFLPLVLLLVGTGITAIALAADYLTADGLPGIGPRQVALALSGLAVLLTGVVLMSSERWRYVGEYLLVGTAVVAVAFAADLLVVNGLPELRDKLIVLASIGFSVLATIVIPIVSADQQNSSRWFNALSLEWSKIGRFLSIVAQLALLVLIAAQLHLENQALYQNIMPLILYGFLIHYFLPTRYRLPFFVLLSLVATAGILGFANGAWLIGVGLALIGICHLPISYLKRVGILIAVGAVLATVRMGWLPVPWLDVIWPVLASMFMFRVIIYLYDLQHGKAKPTLTDTLAYFFLLPNVVFPFFPVIDYSTFRRTYYNEEQHQIYQKGLQWMLRGVIQLIIYRFIYYYVALAPQDVTNTADLIRYIIANFALYIRISGQFHLIIGLLHLFGFNLPETHHLYFLASSFTDLWRRINIYWKDFMMKVFYYPIYFRIRQWGPAASLVAATFFVFFLTWFFHAYQWFWLRGNFLLTVPDVLFWSILALLVVANTLYEDKRGRKRTLTGQSFQSKRDFVLLVLRSVGTFTVMALLWSLWSSESIQDWIALLSVVKPTVADIALIIGTFLTITVLFGLIIWFETRTPKSAGPTAKQAAFLRMAAVTLGSAVVLFLISNPVVYGQIEGKPQEIIKDLTDNRLSDTEAALLQQGYYEDLTGVNRFNSQLWDIYTKRPSDWVRIRDTEAVRATNDNLILELAPSTTINFNGVMMSTNRWGMRDQEYEQTPAPNTYRIALTGPSFVMGLGVADNEDFEGLVEERLNREYAGDRYAKYEILNFAVPAYSAIQDSMVLEQKALPFQPNAIFFMAHQRDEESVVGYIANRISEGSDLPYPELEALVAQAGIAPGSTQAEAERRLSPFGPELLLWTYRHIVEVSQSNDIVPVWIFMPTLEDPLHQEEVVHLTQVAEESGFVIVDLSDAYDNQDPDSLVVAYWDKHPNAKGHRLIADHLYQALEEKKEEIPLFPSDGGQ